MNAEGAAILGFFFVAIVFSVFTVIFHICGLLWAWPGALACARIANEKRLDDKPYMARGALYSALNFWLWFYFIRLMQGKEPSDSLVRAFYILHFANWLFGSIFYSFMWAVILSTRTFDGIHIVVAVWAMCFCGAVSAFLWLVSLVKILREGASYKYAYAPLRESDAELITSFSLRRVYIMPCLFSLVSFLAPNAVMLGVAFTA